jgi:protein tyrosine phosphatase (PTP) superfamily phosphohydrolase (DUF442 family)
MHRSADDSPRTGKLARRIGLTPWSRTANAACVRSFALNLHILLPLAHCLAAITARAVEPSPLALPGIETAFRATERVISGSQPKGDAAFAALATVGVRTIISVDGGRPDVAAANKHGIRYVHLPIGYDGVPRRRIAELARVASDAEGQIFVHCHHGKHRGPAAVGVICEATAGWTPVQAENWLRVAGTADDYPGLYRAVREFSPPTKEEFAKVGPLPEIAEPGRFVDSMVAIDLHFHALKAAQRAGWKTVPGNPDASPAHSATLLWEQIHELARAPDAAKHPDGLRKHLADLESAAAALRAELKESKPEAAALDAHLRAAARSCAACHNPYRDAR